MPKRTRRLETQAPRPPPVAVMKSEKFSRAAYAMSDQLRAKPAPQEEGEAHHKSSGAKVESSAAAGLGGGLRVRAGMRGIRRWTNAVTGHFFTWIADAAGRSAFAEVSGSRVASKGNHGERS